MQVGLRQEAVKGAGALALAALCLFTPSAGEARLVRHAARPARAAAQDMPFFGAFTPAAADPKLAAAFARNGLGADNFSGGAFRFTPAGSNSRRAVTVAVRARVATRAEAGKAQALPAALASSGYSLGASLGWRRFAISGDVSKITPGILPDGREAADIGVSYNGRNWATRLEVAADRASGDRPAQIGLDQSWSVDVGGSYSVTRNFDVTGGLRYRERRDQFNTVQTNDRNSQTIYLGTAFRF